MNGCNILLIKRGVLKLVKQPMAPVMGFAMSLFFLIVYNAGIGGVGSMPEFGAGGYLSFLFPIAVVSLAMGSSAGAGQALDADMQSGYFRRLLLSPASRSVLVLAPMVADACSSLVFTAVLLGIGAAFGVVFQFGIASALGVLALSLLWSVSLSGFSAGIMLRTGKYQSASIVTNSIFILIFLSTTFLPRSLITSKWLLAVAWANPVTYLLEGTRYLLGGTSTIEYFYVAVAIYSAVAVLSVIFALSSARKIKM